MPRQPEPRARRVQQRPALEREQQQPERQRVLVPAQQQAPLRPVPNFAAAPFAGLKPSQPRGRVFRPIADRLNDGLS